MNAPFLSPESVIASAEAFRALHAEDFPVTPSKFGGRPLHECVAAPPARDWLLKDTILARTFVLVVGEPGCGKSFLALDMAMTSALAAVDPAAPRRWFGLKLKPAGVVYIAAEGQEDFIARGHAWLQAHGVAPGRRLPFWLIPTAVDLRSNEATTLALIDEIQAVSAAFEDDYGVSVELVIVDTFNRALAGGDDTNPEHVGAFIRNAAKIREATGATVIAIHHIGKASGRTDPRGHSSLRGDNDGELFVSPSVDGAPNAWTVQRNKAGRAGARHEFRLHAQTIGRDEDGDPITSCCVAVAEPRDAVPARASLGGNATIMMRALADLIERDGREPPFDVRAPKGRKAARMSEWLDEIVRAMPGDDKHSLKFRERCRKARDGAAALMRNRGLIGMDDEWIWRTSKRVALVDPAPRAAS